MHCAAKLERREATPRELRKTVTVLFCDMAGSTPMGERLDPEAVRSVLSRFFDEMQAVLERHGGTVEKFIGDAVMAVFGVPVVHEDDALRAVRAADEMRRSLERLNDELRVSIGGPIAVRTGINTGVVVTGDPTAGQALVVGDAVNVAARLEQTAAPGEILLGTETYELVRDHVTASPGELLELKGKREPVRAYRLLAVAPSPVSARRSDAAPLVGRGAELEALRSAFDDATRDRACGLVTVFGPAGVGKSRLAAEFVASLGADTAVLTGRCLPYGEGITFWPITEVIREACTITDDATHEQARELVAAALAGADDGSLVAQRVAAIAGFSDGPAGLQEAFWAIRRFLEWLARERPLVVVFDDIHWAEPALLDLIEYLAGWSRTEPILIVALARPELLESRPSWPPPGSRSISLSPLTPAESDELIERLLEPAPLDASARERIAAAGEGNPLFVEELLRMLADHGVLRREAGEWRVAADLATIPVPPTIQALLSARLDRLSAEERIVIGCAAVVGKEFWWSAVAALVPPEIRPHVGAHLQTLVRKELIRPDRSTLLGEDAFRFHHILIQEAAYQATSKTDRAELHERFAGWLEETAGDRILEVEEIVGYHLEQAFRYRTELGRVDEPAREVARRAFVRLAAAGRRALALGDVGAAAKLLRKAMALPVGDAAERLSIQPELAEALMEEGDLTGAAEVVDAAIEEADLAGLAGPRAHAEVVRLLLLGMTDPKGRSEAALKELAELIPVFEDLDDDLGLARSWRLLAEIHMNRARYAEADDALERAIRHARRAGAVWEEAESLGQYAGSGAFGPAPVPEVIRRCELIVTQAAGNLTAEARALRAMGTMRAMEGDFEEARELVGRAKRMLEEMGLRLRAAFVSETLGFIEELAGDHAAAERVLREGFEVMELMRERGYLSTVAALLAHAIVEQERVEEAEELTRLSEHAAAEDDLSTQVLWRSARALALARRG
jgi:class 3 adenylate cyclase/tetratricopeptide (TPR) repeat protein